MAHKTQQKKKTTQTVQAVIPNRQNPEESDTQTHIAPSYQPAKRTRDWHEGPHLRGQQRTIVPPCDVER